MPRRLRRATAGLIFHVVNRAARRAGIFETWADYQSFERLLVDALKRGGIELDAYCIMPNHWHLLVIPGTDHAMSEFMHWLTTTHARRWHLARDTNGEGAVYQGRYKAIPVQNDRHFLWVARYIERNALRANLVSRAEDWHWSSLWQRENNGNCTWLAEWPCARPPRWVDVVNAPQTVAEVEAFRKACRKGAPYGDEDWRRQTRRRLGMPEERRRGRPKELRPDPITEV